MKCTYNTIDSTYIPYRFFNQNEIHLGFCLMVMQTIFFQIFGGKTIISNVANAKGGRYRVAVKRPHCNGKDVGSNPAVTRNENGQWGPPREGSPMFQQDLSGRPAMLKLN